MFIRRLAQVLSLSALVLVGCTLEKPSNVPIVVVETVEVPVTREITVVVPVTPATTPTAVPTATLTETATPTATSTATPIPCTISGYHPAKEDEEITSWTNPGNGNRFVAVTNARDAFWSKQEDPKGKVLNFGATFTYPEQGYHTFQFQVNTDNLKVTIQVQFWVTGCGILVPN